MTLMVNNGGSWYPPKQVFINQTNTWNQVKNVYGNIGGTWKLMYAYVNITSTQTNYNLYSAIGSPTSPVTVYVTIASGVQILASANTNYAFNVGSFPTGSKIYIINNGYIIGRGGQGLGKTNSYYGQGSIPSYAYGGPAFYTSVPIIFDNTYGVIGGGGGAGGVGGSTGGDCSCSGCGCGSYSNGNGISGGGAGYGSAGSGICTYTVGCGFSGALTYSGAGGLSTAGGPGCVSNAGASGGLGASGASGSGGSICGWVQAGSGPGASGGSAVVGNANITWINTGNRYGAIQ
jgi:hypothetical protein